jgi:hypothetical protein
VSASGVVPLGGGPAAPAGASSVDPAPVAAEGATGLVPNAELDPAPGAAGGLTGAVSAAEPVAPAPLDELSSCAAANWAPLTAINPSAIQNLQKGIEGKIAAKGFIKTSPGPLGEAAGIIGCATAKQLIYGDLIA